MPDVNKTPYQFEIVPINTLYQHEEILAHRLDKFLEDIEKDQYVGIPVVIDAESMVILDGHHRYNALLKLGMTKVPVAKIDYMDDTLITVEARPESGLSCITKEEIIAMGKSDKTYKPKTTRHKLNFELERVNVPLQELK